MTKMTGHRVADLIIAGRGIAVSPLGRRVLATICTEPKPVGAYEIAALLGRRENGRPTTPNSVYRNLKKLVDCGAVQHIESQRTYIAGSIAAEAASTLLCVCDGCGGVDRVRLPTVEVEIDAAARDFGFQLRRQIVEATGLCRDCVESPGAS